MHGFLRDKVQYTSISEPGISIDSNSHQIRSQISISFQFHFYRTATPQYIRLSLSNTDFKDDLVVMLHESATRGFDAGLDARKLKNVNLSFYSMLEEQEMAIQTFSDEFDEIRIPLAYETFALGQYTLQLDEVRNLPPHIDILLQDVSTGEEYDLRNLDRVELTLDSKTELGRLSLTLRANEVLAAENIGDGLLIQGSENQLSLIGDYSGLHKVTLYDLSGRTVHEELVSFEDNRANMNVNLSRDKLLLLRIDNQTIKFILK